MSQSALQHKIQKLAKDAKQASYVMALVSTDDKNKALECMARALFAQQEYLIKENKKDLASAAKQKLSTATVDRLMIDAKRISAMAQGLRDTIQISDPVGELLWSRKRPNGLVINKVRVPLGVVGIIYESRPNVTSDCIGLCLKSGNAAILKGGKEAIHSNKAIFKVLKESIQGLNMPSAALQLIDSLEREAVQVLLKQDQYIDVIVPRGGEGLIKFVADHSRIPVIKHYKGVCHTYVSDKANLAMAKEICYNAKVQRPGVCNAMETMLVHKDVAARFLPSMIEQFQKAGVEIRGCANTRKIVKGQIKKATQDDWTKEYLDLILSVRVVDGTQQAIEHINIHGSHHSDAIVTEDQKEARHFMRSVDSATLYVNASTRFTDGYEFGFGAEVGISTDKIHARGPMALEELTTYKYEVFGQGQVRG
jgi:glutamate-5-semialdehyde dehydrogenase